MRALVATDWETLGGQVRHALLQQGYQCPPSDVIPLHQAVLSLSEPEAELILLVLQPDAARALAMLEELRELTDARILAVGPTDDAKLILQTLRSGADEYLDVADISVELDRALTRRKSGTSPVVHKGRVIAVLAPSGGSGASTLAVNLAAGLAQELKKVLLVDLKLQLGDLGALLDLKPDYTLADLCQHLTHLDRVMLERSVAVHSSGAHLLSSPRTFLDGDHITPDGVRQILTLARHLFPVTIIDVDHSCRSEQVQALRLADPILLVFRLDFTSLRNVRRTLEYLSQLGVSPGCIRLVVSRHGQPSEVPPAKAEDVLRTKIFHFIPDDPKAINRANNNGVPPVLENPSSRVARSYIQLASAVRNLFQEAH